MDPRLARTDLRGARRLVAAKRSLTGDGSGSIPGIRLPNRPKLVTGAQKLDWSKALTCGPR